MPDNLGLVRALVPYTPATEAVRKWTPCRSRLPRAPTATTLNLDKVGEPRDRLRQARRRLAEAARAWQTGALPSRIRAAGVKPGMPNGGLPAVNVPL